MYERLGVRSSPMSEHADAAARAAANALRNGALPVASVALACVVFDAFTMRPTESEAVDAPASLRCSGFVAILSLASPAFQARTAQLQIGTSVFLLAATAVYGLHNGTPAARSADATYAGIVGWLVIAGSHLATGTGPSDRCAQSNVPQLFATGLATGAYAGIRYARNCLLGCGELRGLFILWQTGVPFQIADSLPGCGGMPALCGATSGLVAAAAFIASLGLLRRGDADPCQLAPYCRLAADVLGCAACVQLIAVGTLALANANAALVEATLGDSSDAIAYANQSCSAAADCTSIRQARRALLFGVSPIEPAVLLATASIAAASALVRAARNHDPHSRQLSRRCAPTATVFGLTCVVLLLLVLRYTTYGNRGREDSYVDLCALGALVGMTICGFLPGQQLPGAMVMLTAACVEAVGALVLYNWAALGYFTRFSGIWLTVLFTAFGASLAAGRRWQQLALDIAVAARSLSTFLLLATTAMLALYSGSSVPKRGGDFPYHRGAFSFLISHFVHASGWCVAEAALSIGEAGEATAQRRWRRLALWIGPTLFCGLSYITYLLAGPSQLPDDYPTPPTYILAIVSILVIIPTWLACST